MLNRFWQFTASVGLVALGIGLGFLMVNPWLIFLPWALWLGWLQVGSLWGLSLVGALTPLGQGSKTRYLYLQALAAHTGGSMMSSALAGGLMGWLGGRGIGQLPAHVLWLGLAGLSLALAWREFEGLRFPIPQWPRQTKKTWYHRFGAVGAAYWWGIDLGSGLITRVTFSGYWLLVLAILFQGTPVYGGLVLGLYGLGRALAVGIPPVLLGEMHIINMLNLLLDQRPRLHRWHGYGLVGLALGLALRGIS